MSLLKNSYDVYINGINQITHELGVFTYIRSHNFKIIPGPKNCLYTYIHKIRNKNMKVKMNSYILHVVSQTNKTHFFDVLH